MERLPTREYECQEGSPAAALLETLGVFLVQGRRVITLDPILMIALLALQGKVVPTVSKLIKRWREEDEEAKEEYETRNDQPDPKGRGPLPDAFQPHLVTGWSEGEGDQGAAGGGLDSGDDAVAEPGHPPDAGRGTRGGGHDGAGQVFEAGV